MKKILTSVLVLMFVSNTFGQNLRIFDLGVDVTNDTITVPVMAGSAAVNDLEIHNVTSSAVTFKVGRIISPIDSCANVYFCTGTLCYSPQTATTWYPTGSGQTINAMSNLPSGPGTYGIAAHYDVCPTFCNTDFTVKYVLYNTFGTPDTSFVTINYVCTSGIDENAQEVNAIAFPNPASSTLSINYSIKESYNHGKIIVFNMLGKQVKELVISDKQAVAKLNVSDLTAGIYFYSLVIDDKTMVTKKLIVSSK